MPLDRGTRIEPLPIYPIPCPICQTLYNHWQKHRRKIIPSRERPFALPPITIPIPYAPQPTTTPIPSKSSSPPDYDPIGSIPSYLITTQSSSGSHPNPQSIFPRTSLFLQMNPTIDFLHQLLVSITKKSQVQTFPPNDPFIKRRLDLRSLPSFFVSTFYTTKTKTRVVVQRTIFRTIFHNPRANTHPCPYPLPLVFFSKYGFFRTRPRSKRENALV